MHIPEQPQILSLLDRYRLEDAADAEVSQFLDVANYGEYRSSVTDRLDLGGCVYAAEATAHYEVELMTAMSERESPNVLALAMVIIAENWDRGACHLFDSADAADPGSNGSYPLTVGTDDTGRAVIRMEFDVDFDHEPGSCYLASTLNAVVRDLGVVGDDAEVTMHDRSVRYGADADAAELGRAALTASGWRIV